MDIAQFRLDYPEFSDNTIYTDSMITYWSTLAENNHSQSRFADAYNYIIELYTAHKIDLQAQRIAGATSSSGASADAAGMVSMMQIGPVEIEYDTTMSSYTGAGEFNLTNYGKQYWELAKMFGKGGMLSSIGFLVL